MLRWAPGNRGIESNENADRSRLRPFLPSMVRDGISSFGYYFISSYLLRAPSKALNEFLLSLGRAQVRLVTFTLDWSLYNPLTDIGLFTQDPSTGCVGSLERLPTILFESGRR